MLYFRLEFSCDGAVIKFEFTYTPCPVHAWCTMTWTGWCGVWWHRYASVVRHPQPREVWSCQHDTCYPTRLEKSINLLYENTDELFFRSRIGTNVYTRKFGFDTITFQYINLNNNYYIQIENFPYMFIKKNTRQHLKMFSCYFLLSLDP